MTEKKLPTGPIRIEPPATKKDDPTTVIPTPDELHPKLAQPSQKVSMRLSEEAASVLKRFRLDEGIPYEILVEIMILNFHQLPERIRKAYLEQGKELRTQRLIAGQEKALETMKSKAKKGSV